MKRLHTHLLIITLFCACSTLRAQRTITDFTPKSGKVGDVITIRGSGLNHKMICSTTCEGVPQECDCTKRDCERDGCSPLYIYNYSFVNVGGDDITIEYADTSFTYFWGSGHVLPYEINSAGTEMKVRVPTGARTGRISTWYYYWEDEENSLALDRVYSSDIFTVIEHTGGGSGGGTDAKVAALETSQQVQDGKITAQDTKISANETEIEALKVEIKVLKEAAVGGTTTVFNVPTAGSPHAYPNPASHRLRFANLSSDRLYTYKIYTTAGWQVLSGRLQSDEAVDISTLSAGPYILVLQDDSSSEILRGPLLIK